MRPHERKSGRDKLLEEFPTIPPSDGQCIQVRGKLDLPGGGIKGA